MNSKFVALLAVGVFLQALSMSRADVAARSTPDAGEALTTVTIQLRNVRPTIMAWWLDPQHQPEPNEFKLSRRADEQWFGGVINAPGAPVPRQGILRVVAHDDKNEIEVTGTAQGLHALRAEIERLDKPFRQIELESQFVVLDKAEIQQFSIDDLSGNFPGRYNVGRVRGNFAAVLHKLQEKDTRVIQAPRATVLNSFTAALSFNTNEPLERHPNLSLVTSIGLVCNATIGVRNEIFLAVAQPIQWSLQVTTPQASGGNTASELTNPFLRAGSTEPNRQPNPVPLTRPAFHVPIAMTAVADGDTIIISGARQKTVTRGGQTLSYWSFVPGVGALGDPDEKGTERELVIFLSARIIRRAE